jgi:hypothetical protein
MQETHVVSGPTCASFLEAVQVQSKWAYGWGDSNWKTSKETHPLTRLGKGKDRSQPLEAEFQIMSFVNSTLWAELHNKKYYTTLSLEMNYVANWLIGWPKARGGFRRSDLQHVTAIRRGDLPSGRHVMLPSEDVVTATNYH